MRYQRSGLVNNPSLVFLDYSWWIKRVRLARPRTAVGIVAPYAYMNKAYDHTHCGHLEDVPNLEQSSLNLVADLGSRHAGANSVSPSPRQPKWGTGLKSSQGAETGCRTRCWRGIMRNRTRKQSINA
jgi:hypothetical protein